MQICDPSKLKTLITENEKITQHNQELLSEIQQVKTQINSIKGRNFLISENHRLSTHPRTREKLVDLRDYLMNLQLPRAIPELVRRSDYSVSFLMRTGVFPYNSQCPQDDSAMLISYNTSDGYCFLCNRCNFKFSVKRGTFWERSTFTPKDIILIIFGLSMNMTNNEIVHISDNYDRTISKWCTNVRRLIAHWFKNTIKQFTGVVEIDESCFYANRRKNECWAFGFYERHTGCTYMVPVKVRTMESLLPIIRERCAPGCTIISDQWSAYSKLSDLGYYHYTVDHSRFFVDPHNREINTQSIELSWLWAKRDIKRKDVLGKYFPTMLMEFCWRRQFKSGTQYESSAVVARELCKVMEEYRKGNAAFKGFEFFGVQQDFSFCMGDWLKMGYQLLSRYLMNNKMKSFDLTSTQILKKLKRQRLALTKQIEGIRPLKRLRARKVNKEPTVSTQATQELSPLFRLELRKSVNIPLHDLNKESWLKFTIKEPSYSPKTVERLNFRYNTPIAGRPDSRSFLSNSSTPKKDKNPLKNDFSPTSFYRRRVIRPSTRSSSYMA